MLSTHSTPFAATMTTHLPHTTPETHAPEAQVDTNKLVAERREKLAVIRAQGVAFPNDFKPADRAAPLHAAHDATEAPELEAQNVSASVGGRLMLKRVMGKACLAPCRTPPAASRST